MSENWCSFWRGCRFFVYACLAVFAMFGMYKLSWKFIDQAFPPPSASAPSADVPVQVESCHEAYKDSYDFFNRQLTIILMSGGLLITVFGLAIPFASYLLQRQSINDQRDIIKSELKRELETSMNLASNQINALVDSKLNKTELINKATELIVSGELLLSMKHHIKDGNYDPSVFYVFKDTFDDFSENSLTLIQETFGKEHDFYKRFFEKVKNNTADDVDAGVRILKEIKVDLGWRSKNRQPGKSKRGAGNERAT